MSRYRRPLKILRDFVREIYYWDLRTLNNAKPYFFLNEMNKMYSTAFWCLLSFYCFLALLRNRCYSFHRTKWRLVITSICRGPGPLATRMPFFFCRNSNPLQIFHLQPKRETSSSSLEDRLEKRSMISSLNRAICAGNRGTSGFRPVPVTTVALAN